MNTYFTTKEVEQIIRENEELEQENATLWKTLNLLTRYKDTLETITKQRDELIEALEEVEEKVLSQYELRDVDLAVWRKVEEALDKARGK